MHIVLGILGTVVTILILLNRLADVGIDIGWLNPFLWNRRRKWRQKVTGDPIYTLDRPMEVTALLMVAVAKCDGDMSAEQKRLILDLFEREFHLSRREASGLLTSSVFLLKDGEAARTDLAKLLTPSRELFTREQADSAMALIGRVANCEGKPTEMQAELIEGVRAGLSNRRPTENKWS